MKRLAFCFIVSLTLGCTTTVPSSIVPPSTVSPAEVHAPATRVETRPRIRLNEIRPRKWRALHSHGDTVIAAGSDGSLRRLDKWGRFVWVNKGGSRAVDFLRISSDERLVAAVEKQLVRVVDTQSGKLVSKLELEVKPTDLIPDFVRKRVYAAHNNRVWAFDLVSGKVLWAVELPSQPLELLQNPAEGTLIAHCNDGLQFVTPDGALQKRIELAPSRGGRTRGSVSRSGRYIVISHEELLLFDSSTDASPVEIGGTRWQTRGLRIVDDPRVDVLEDDTLAHYDLSGARLGKPIDTLDYHNADVAFGPDDSVFSTYGSGLVVWRDKSVRASNEISIASTATNEQHATLVLGVQGGVYVFDVAEGKLRHYLDTIAPPIAVSPNGEVLAAIVGGGIVTLKLRDTTPTPSALGYAPPGRNRLWGYPMPDLVWRSLLFLSDDLLLSSANYSSSWMWSRSTGGVIRFIAEGGKVVAAPGGRTLFMSDERSTTTVRTSDGERLAFLPELASPVAVTPHEARLATAKSPGFGSFAVKAPGVSLAKWYPREGTKTFAVEETVLDDCLTHGLTFNAAGDTLAALCASGRDEFTLVAYDLKRRLERFSKTIPMEDAESYFAEPRELRDFRGTLLLSTRGGVQVYDWHDGHWRGEIRLLPNGGWVVATAGGYVDGTEDAWPLLRLEDNSAEQDVPDWADLRTPNALRRLLTD